MIVSGELATVRPVVSKVVEKVPPEPMVADCSTPSSVTATVSPTGACEPSASVPEMVTLEVP